MEKILSDLKDEIIDTFGNHYVLNDPAHRIPHFEDVFQTGLAINEALKTSYDPKLILFVGFFHDLFAWSRKNHHDLSGDFILETDHKFILKHLNQEERLLVSAGCREHRASRVEPFTCEFSEMMNAADRGTPKSVTQMVMRSIQYKTHRTPGISYQDAVTEAVTHIKEKYGTNGYASYPSCYEITFGDSLAKQRAIIDNLTVESYQELVCEEEASILKCLA